MHSQKVLAEFIYKLDQSHSFHIKDSFWSSPSVYFACDRSGMRSGIKRGLTGDGFYVGEDEDQFICELSDWGALTGYEGIFFTDTSLYVNSPKNKKNKKFKVRYDDISWMYYSVVDKDLTINTKNSDYFTIHYDIWSKRSIHDFLQFAIGKYEFSDANHEDICNIILDSAGGIRVGDMIHK